MHAQLLTAVHVLIDYLVPREVLRLCVFDRGCVLCYFLVLL